MDHHYRLRLVTILLIAITSSCGIKNDASNESIDVPTYSNINTPGETRLPVETPALTLEPVSEVPVIVYQLSSPAFTHKSAIPLKYSCKGDNISPELSWSDPPEGTMSYGLIMDDPDAPVGTWVHWVLYNIPGKIRGLPESIPQDKVIADLGVSGVNSASKFGYSGPCPPIGTHRYFFRLYALDTLLDLKPGATKPDLIKAMQGHILAVAELMGTYTH